MKRKIKSKKGPSKRRKIIDNLFDILNEPPDYGDIKIDSIPLDSSKWIRIPKLSKNPRWKIHQRIRLAILGIKDIEFNGRVHSYLTSSKQKKKAKELGYTSGLPHVSVFNPIKKYKGFHLLIRLEDEKKPLTEFKVLANQHRNGYAIAICDNSKDGVKLVKLYLKGYHKKMKKLAFKGKMKLKDILKYKKLYNPKTKLQKKRSGEYRIHSDTPNLLIEKHKESVIDGQPQGNLTPYYGLVGKSVGYRLNMCDLLVWKAVGKYNGFAVEIKKEGEKPRKGQREFMEILRGLGWFVTDETSALEIARKFGIYLSAELHYALEE